MRKAMLQFQDVSGKWSTVAVNVDTDDVTINMRLNELQKRCSGKRVRAIDSQTGALIDLR